MTHLLCKLSIKSYINRHMCYFLYMYTEQPTNRKIASINNSSVVYTNLAVQERGVNVKIRDLCGQVLSI